MIPFHPIYNKNIHEMYQCECAVKCTILTQKELEEKGGPLVRFKNGRKWEMFTTCTMTTKANEFRCPLHRNVSKPIIWNQISPPQWTINHPMKDTVHIVSDVSKMVDNKTVTENSKKDCEIVAEPIHTTPIKEEEDDVETVRDDSDIDIDMEVCDMGDDRGSELLKDSSIVVHRPCKPIAYDPVRNIPKMDAPDTWKYVWYIDIQSWNTYQLDSEGFGEIVGAFYPDPNGTYHIEKISVSWNFGGKN